MSDSTYTARLVGGGGTDSIELDLIDGRPQKSFVRPIPDGCGDMVWEIVPDSEDGDGAFEYREAGMPGADYS
jgi:hypothetical protein